MNTAGTQAPRQRIYTVDKELIIQDTCSNEYEVCPKPASIIIHH